MCTASAWHVHGVCMACAWHSRAAHLLVTDQVVAYAEGGMHPSVCQRSLDTRADLVPEPEPQVVHEPAPADREECKVDCVCIERAVRLANKAGAQLPEASRGVHSTHVDRDEEAVAHSGVTRARDELTRSDALGWPDELARRGYRADISNDTVLKP